MADDKPSYLGAFLRHPSNRNALLLAALAAVGASFPLGMSGVALVGILALGAETLAALLVPSLPSFRAWVDRSQRFDGRAARKDQLIAEIRQLGDSRVLSTYQHMWTRVQSLYQTVQQFLQELVQSSLSLCFCSISVHALSARKFIAN